MATPPSTQSASKDECTHHFLREGPLCPCCEHTVPVHAGTSNVRLLHGQRIYLCCEDCKFQFVSDPSSYFATEGEHVARGQSQKEWLDQKDYDHFQVWCPGCNTSLRVDETTPRVHLIHGQTLFFRCYECVVDFLAKPERVFANCENMCPPKTSCTRSPEQLKAEQAQSQPASEVQEGQEKEGHQKEEHAKAEHLEEKRCEWTEEKIEFCRRKHHHGFKPTEKYIKKERSGKALCLGCGNQICFSTHAEFVVEFVGGQRIFFCSKGCMSGFAENPVKALKSAKSFRHKEAEFLNLEGMIMTCPTCEGRKLPLTTTTPRIYFEHGQSLFFDSHACLETFCASSSKYVHTCSGVSKARTHISSEVQEQDKAKPKKHVQEAAAASPHSQMPLSKEDFDKPAHSTTQKVPLEQCARG